MSNKRRMVRGAATLAGVAVLGAGALASYQVASAADHTDGPVVTADQAADIADVYSFQNGQNLVLAMTISNVQASPQIQAGQSIFDPGVLYQFNIDVDGDAVQDQVIQAFAVGDATDQMMHVRGPVVPDLTGNQASLVQAGSTVSVQVSTDGNAITQTSGGVSVFAGVRDDPFFFDLGQFQAVLGGQAAGFNDPGTDTFAGLNVYAIVVEMPLSALGGAAADVSVWGSTYRQ